MGFDITGLNPKNIKIKSPKCPKDLFNGCSEKEQNKYFDELAKFQEQKGTYFRNNVWWWRPLAHYVLEYTKVIDEDKKKYWSTNDFYTVEDEEAVQIAKQLKHLINTGHTKRFSAQWEARRKTLEIHNDKVDEELNQFTESVKKKMRNDNLAPKDFPEEDHKKWEEIYNKRNSDGSYPFEEESVKEFSEFCKNCGGFTIG